MRPAAWTVCALWIAAAVAFAVGSGARALRQGRGRRVAARLRSPTPYLFAGYLVVAALVTARSPGEETSPLGWLALVLIAAYALASFAAAGVERPTVLRASALAALYGGAVLATSAIVLALASPAFVPAWLR